jgi:acetate kinase
VKAHILVINCGSSSIKYELFDAQGNQSLAEGMVERIGEPESAFRYRAGKHDLRQATRIPSHDAGMLLIARTLTDKEVGVITEAGEVFAVGHRVVHGGERFVESALVTPEVITAIEQHARFAPLHNPANLVGIRAAQRLFPDVPHVAVFDTAFHQTMPARAYLYALPYELYQEHGVRRYGFHGTSHRYLCQAAAHFLKQPLGQLRLITCHLGNGCSISAVAQGRCVDTSMGFTPLEGLVMGTRSGDLDPALVAILGETLRLGPAEVVRLLNTKSGLLGLSGVSNDMRLILKAAAEGNERARLALEVFCYRARKYVGSYLVALGGADALVFSAGIGENSPEARGRIAGGLDELGIVLDEAANQQARGVAADIAGATSRIRVLVIPTDEERLIAEDTYRTASEVRLWREV